MLESQKQETILPTMQNKHDKIFCLSTLMKSLGNFNFRGQNNFTIYLDCYHANEMISKMGGHVRGGAEEDYFTPLYN